MAHHDQSPYNHGGGPAPYYQDTHGAPPPPPQHRDLVNPEMSRPAYPGQQSYYSNHDPNHNPFNDSSAALSQRSSRTSSVMGGALPMGEMHTRHGPPRGYSDSIHSGSSGSNQYTMDQFQRGHRSPNERAAMMGGQSPYQDNPYNRYSSVWDNSVEQPFNPDEIADDGDDGLGPPPSQSGRRSAMGSKSRSNQSLPVAAGAAGGLAGAAVGDSQAMYGPVSAADRRMERNLELAQEAAARKKKRLVFIILGVAVIIAVIAAGTIAGVLLSRKDNGSSNSGGGKSAAQDDSTILTSKSSEIQALMNNNNLHRVFPGMDYTPFNAQYPDCLTNPPSQNNVTRDMAVLSQLTNVVRLYGTDCNQTDMVLESLNLLGITDMKIWLAVWLDNNQTTNDRGMSAMWDILERHQDGPWAGVVIGNEVLFRKDMTLTQLSDVVSDVRTNFTKQGLKLPIAIADLGDNWTAGLAALVDVVMSNIHPFFAGKTPQESTDWTLNFWKTHDVILTQGTNKRNIISETGWPSAGGQDCGEAKCTSDDQGAIASIDNMNTFMDGFVCKALKDGTDYFWFEAFDEPWKEKFNNETSGEMWETEWGLMDPGRVLKSGIKIPDCGGQTVKQNW